MLGHVDLHPGPGGHIESNATGEVQIDAVFLSFGSVLQGERPVGEQPRLLKKLLAGSQALQVAKLQARLPGNLHTV